MRQRRILSAVILAALLLVGFAATSLISYYVAHDSLARHVEQETLPLTSDNIFSEIQRDLLRSTLISSLMAHDTFVRDWTLHGEQDTGRIVRYLRQIQHKYDTTTAFFVSDKTRRYYHSTGVLKTVSADDPRDAWYFRVRRMHKPYEINVDYDTADRDRLDIFVNYRVTDYDGHYLGAIGIGLSVHAVTQLIEQYQQRYGRQIYFVDREGRVTVRGSGFDGSERIQSRAGLGPFATRILANPSTAFSYRNAGGQTVYVNSRLVPEFNWILLVEQTASRGEARIQHTLIVNLLVALAISALVFGLAYYTVRGYQRRLEAMATTDKLTGAANRQIFDLLFGQAVKTARRRGERTSLVAVDIDRFKALNDTYGHQGGDVIIRALVATLRQQIRDTDTVCRWGGDELLLLLSGCDLNAAHRLAESIREAVERRPMHFGREQIFVTVSLGVAEHRPGDDLETTVRRADDALYRSKQLGRNRTTDA